MASKPRVLESGLHYYFKQIFFTQDINKA